MFKPRDRSVSTALSVEASNATHLGRILSPKLAAHPGESGFITLGDAHDAFAARIVLAQKAERTLDI
ncbi:MAG: phospholipase D family protein, partial [Alcaligenaceae bacterium]|nr:phospholipase D family protein [Alcaligenaceae bacterium]